MIKHFIRTALRTLMSSPLYTLIHLVGLSCGFAAAMLIATFVQNELSYDRFHSQADNIAQLVAYRDDGSGELSPIKHLPLPLGPALKEEEPAVGRFMRVSGADQTQVVVGDVQDNEYILFADSTLFTMFDFPLVRGDASAFFHAPDEVVLTEGAAK